MLKSIRQRAADQHVGLLAEFSDPGALYDAMKAIRKKGYTKVDTFSPFPIHGMDAAMGLKTSPLGFFVFVGGTVGLLLAIFLQWWTSAGGQPDWLATYLQAYPINISNKPLFAWESSVPIMFELTVLFSALTAIGGMLALNGLPKPYNPLFFSERFSSATDDGFFLHVGVRDGQFDASSTAADLFDVGAMGVESITHDGAEAVSQTGDAIVPASEPTHIVPAHTTGEI
ncbi:MAG: DUF3341 domain-containing protein [Rubricoccaceae bacterium]